MHELIMDGKRLAVVPSVPAAMFVCKEIQPTCRFAWVTEWARAYASWIRVARADNGHSFIVEIARVS